MENKEKIELMRKRIDYFYKERRLDALKYHCNDKTFKDFALFCEKSFNVVDYCFYLGEYCKKNRKWLAEYSKWENYKSNDFIIEKMCLIIKALIFEIQLDHEGRNNKILNEINSILDESNYQFVENGDVSDIKNARMYLVYSFMAGLMDVVDDEIDSFWKTQYGFIERREHLKKTDEQFMNKREERQSDVSDDVEEKEDDGTIIFDDGRTVIREYEFYDKDGILQKERRTTYYPFRPIKRKYDNVRNPEDMVMDALMNGNGDAIGF